MGSIQGRREPNVVAGLAQICRNSGSVKSKIDLNFYQKQRFFWPKLGDPPQKKVFTEISTVFLAEMRRSPKKIILLTCDFDELFISQCHLDGPPLEFMGPLNSMGPGVIVPPLGGPGSINQRWSPRGHNLKSFASAFKVKFLALKPASPRKVPRLRFEDGNFFHLLKLGQGHDLFCFM